MYRFQFLKNAHCHPAEAEAIKAKADAAVEAAVIKAAVQLVLAVHLLAAQVQAQAVAVKAVQVAEGVQDALADTNHKNEKRNRLLRQVLCIEGRHETATVSCLPFLRLDFQVQ